MLSTPWLSQFSPVALSCPTLYDPMAHQASLSTTNSWSLLKLMSIESVARRHPTWGAPGLFRTLACPLGQSPRVPGAVGLGSPAHSPHP